ncbi:hypothetical protein DFJ73DRAFT_920574 [Zopfochytrium polystomum]|nr:hypothetical protein DFJ73DRAFT_920574 [Zopfochytrium polystomum]
MPLLSEIATTTPCFGSAPLAAADVVEVWTDDCDDADVVGGPVPSRDDPSRCNALTSANGAAQASLSSNNGNSSRSADSQSLGGWRLAWDPAKIFVAPDAVSSGRDELFLRNVALGLIVTGKVWPIILPNEETAHPDARHRTVGFLKRAVLQPADLLGPLDYDQRCGVAASVRDLWLACNRRLFDDPAELADMRALTSALSLVLEDSFLPLPSVAGVHVSFFPRMSCRVPRFAPDFPSVLAREGRRVGLTDGGDGVACEEDQLGELFVQYAVDGADPFYYTWVDASDLSYHNFECILPLDRVLKPPEHKDEARLSFWTSSDCTWIRPMQGQRGGKRLIFSSTALASGLTRAILDSNLFEVMLGDKGRRRNRSHESNSENDSGSESESDANESESESESESQTTSEEEVEPSFLSDGTNDVGEAPSPASQSWVTPALFRFVNYVFRLNKFEPTDEKFRLHRDTPYYDGTRNHLSKYTMLIYLTPGEASGGALKIFKNTIGKQSELEPKTTEQDVSVVENIGSAQCIIFDQRYSHEGNPFDSGSKIFLRTELIFECPQKIQHIPRIGSLFSSAVYHTIESALDDEFSNYAHELYERVNKSHWGILAEDDAAGKVLEATPILIKKWKGLAFATDGSSYWFPTPPDARNDNHAGVRPLSDQKSIQLHIKLCATVVLLDFFNSKLSQSGAAFRKDCKTTVGKPPTQASSISQLDDWVLREISHETTDYNGSILPICEANGRKKRLLELEKKGDRKKWLANRLLGEGGNVPVTKDVESDSDSEKDSDDVEEETSDDGESNGKLCCAYHNDGEFESWRFKKAINSIAQSPIVLLGEEFSLDPKCVEVSGSAVVFNTARGVPRINFAACWTEGMKEEAYIGEKTVGQMINVHGLPPMPFQFVGGGSARGVRFQTDFFKNDWVDDAAGSHCVDKTRRQPQAAALGELPVKIPVFRNESYYVFE